MANQSEKHSYRVEVENTEKTFSYSTVVEAASHEEASDKAAELAESLQRDTLPKLLVKTITRELGEQQQ